MNVDQQLDFLQHSVKSPSTLTSIERHEASGVQFYQCSAHSPASLPVATGHFEVLRAGV